MGGQHRAWRARLLCGWMIATAAMAGDPEPPVVGLDHIPIAVGDLDQAAADFRRLGFVLKPGRQHENSIRNQHIKFRDGTELELITAGEIRDELTATYRRHLTEGDGPAFLALFARDMDALSRRLQALAQPFQAEHGLISLTDPPACRFIFFSRRNHSPTDRPEHFEHPNGVTSLIGVWLAPSDPTRQRELLSALGANMTEEFRDTPRLEAATVATVAEGSVTLLPAHRQLAADRPIVGAVLKTRDLDILRRELAKAHVKIDREINEPGRRSLFLSPQNAHGLWLEFRER